MARPPYHIASLRLDCDGWIVPKIDGGPERRDGGGRSPELTPGCKDLLKELKLKLDPSCRLFGGDAGPESDGAEDAPLEELSHLPRLHNLFLKVIADVRRLGAPSERELRRSEEKGGGREGRRRDRRGRGGKVAQLEEQRRLRKQQEEQKLDQTNHLAARGEETEGVDGERDDGGEASSDDDDFIVVGEGSGRGPAEGCEISGPLRLAAVFNSLRILITLIRPMLDHPHRSRAGLKMKHGPSIKKAGRLKFYLFSRHVYSCVSLGCWKEINREYDKLLNETREGLSDAMSKLNDDGRYDLNARDWLASLFDHELCNDKELVARKCMGLSTPNPEVPSKVHDALMNRFENMHGEKQRLLQRSIEQLQQKLHSTISRRFNNVRLTVYGSCLSGLALEGSHDVDVSIFIPELDRLKQDFDAQEITAAEYERKMRRIIYRVRDSLEHSRKFDDLFAVTRARVPVIKGTDGHARNPYAQDGSLSFDLCFLNDIAVVNSSLLREYSLFDGRVRILMLSVKSFAKANGIASAADGTLSSYSWLNMVVFYLQCIGLVPVLQCPKLMEEHGFVPTNDHWQNVNGLKTFYLTRDMVAEKNAWESPAHLDDTNMAMLLYGFFNFYSKHFPRETVAGSIRFGDCTLQKTSFPHTSKLWRICLEDPFETCDSHCPHDLGCHVKEGGQKEISERLARATEELAGLMQEETTPSDDHISAVLCRLLGPVPQSTNGKVESAAGSVAQSKHHRPQNAFHRDKRSPGARGNHPNAGAKARQNRNNQQPHRNGKRGGGRDGNGKVSQKMKGGSMDGEKDHTQTTKRGKNAKKGQGSADPKRTGHRKQTSHTNNPGANDKGFIRKQKQKIQEMKTSNETNRDADSKRKQKRGIRAHDAAEKT